ncbi:MAG: hypothetical protein PHS44_01460, partial [Candidatus Dojkabacteria bacterium]|nr:hypothetical protein [Candidatus Dojkabacteria bacterium]
YNWEYENQDYLCWGGDEPTTPYLDIQYFDEEGEIDYGPYCVPSGGDTPCTGDDFEVDYIFVPGGLDSEVSDNEVHDDGVIQVFGDDPDTVEDEGYWLLATTLAGDNYPPTSCDFGSSLDVRHVINHPPVADAGSDQSVSELEAVALDGTGSSDEDSECQSLVYAWDQIDTTGYDVVLDSPNSQTPAFTAPDITEDSITLTFELTVTDGQFDSVDEVDVVISQSEDMVMSIETECIDHETFDIVFSFGISSWWEGGNAPPNNITCDFSQVSGVESLILDPETVTITALSDDEYPLSVSTHALFEEIPSSPTETYSVRVVCDGGIQDSISFTADDLVECCQSDDFDLPDTGELPDTHLHGVKTEWFLFGSNLILIGLSTRVLFVLIRKSLNN